MDEKKKAYLKRAERIDKQIESKLRHIDVLKDLTTKVTATLSDAPKGTSKTTSHMEAIIVQICDLEVMIQKEVEKLIKTEVEYIALFNQIEDKTQQMVLEQRYLCFKSWKEIAEYLNYSIQHVQRIHTDALVNIDKLLDDERK